MPTVPHHDKVMQEPSPTPVPDTLEPWPDNDLSQAQDPGALPCRHCGVVDRPTLSPGTGPHACKASCGHCGRFLRWISVLAPSERVARKVKARLEAMQKHPPTQAQMEYLRQLGDKLATPGTMAEASERIEQLKSLPRTRSGGRQG